MKKRFTALALIGSVVLTLAAPAAANASTPKPLHWNVTTNHFGPYRVGENLRDVAKKSHVDYEREMGALYKSSHSERGSWCLDGGPQVKVPLLKSYVNRDQITAVVSPACASPEDDKLSYSAFVKKYRPYTTGSKIITFSATRRENGGSGPVANLPAYGPYLPHAGKVYINYGKRGTTAYATIRKQFKGYKFDTHLLTGTKAWGTTVHNGYVGVSKAKSRAKIWFFLNADTLDGITQTARGVENPMWMG